MKTISYLLLFVFCFAGCKPAKQIIETKESVSEHKNLELSETKESHTHLSENIETNESLNIATGIIENMLFTLWSAPDSSGLQYPVVTSEINRQTNIHQQEEKNTNSNTELTNDELEQSNLTDKGKTDTKVQSKEIKEDKDIRFRWAIGIGLLLGIGLVVWLSKR